MTNQYQNKLAHLSQDEIEKLIVRYYNGEKSTLLIQEYNIDVKNSLLLKTFPLKIHNDKLCSFCDIPMVSQRESKSTYTSKWHRAKIFCQECNHEYDNIHCHCFNCKERRNQIQQSINDEQLKILVSYCNAQIPIDIQQLSIKSKVYLCSLLRANLSENLNYINPAITSKLSFAPTQDYQRKIIVDLFHQNIICFSPRTNLDSIIIENNQIKSFIALKATYELNIEKEEYVSTITNLLHLNNINNINSEERLELWLEIGLHECLEFLYVKISEYNLPTEHIGDKTIHAIKDALTDFSISQVFNFLWNATKSAAAFYQKDHITKQHAVNTIANNILKSKEKAIAEQWDVKKYGRDYNYPQTLISEVFFNNILRIGNRGFEEVMH